MRKSLSLLFLFTGAALSAQSITGGVYTGLSLPVGDLKDKSDLGTNQFFGAHVGGHLDFQVAPRHEVRAHLTLQNFPGSGWGGFAASKNDYKALQAGADWIYRFEGLHRGWYSVAGANLNQIKSDWEYVNGAGRWTSGSSTQSGKLGVRGGAGYIFNRTFALEGTLNQIFVDKSGADGFGYDTATWLQVSAVFRFGK